MTRSRPRGAFRRACWPVVLFTHALTALAAAAAAAGAEGAGAASSSSSPSADEIVISAQRFDRRTLERDIVPQFVKTHGAPVPRLQQLTRWYEAVCPEVAGAPPEYAAAVTGRIFAAAQASGAPNAGAGHSCSQNISILFSNSAQQLLDGIAKDHPALLGSGRTQGDTTVSRAIQVWYLTGTRQLSGDTSGTQTPVPMSSRGMTGIGGMARGGMGTGMGGMGMNNGGTMAPVTPPAMIANMPDSAPSTRLVPDPAFDNTGASGGVAGSRALQLRSELLHVTILVDAQKLNGMSLQVISDYMALLALTRITELDTCNALPSIVDQLAAQCAERDKPGSLSDSDAAFLKALYGSNLEGRIGAEQAEVNKKMLAALKKNQH